MIKQPILLCLLIVFINAYGQKKIDQNKVNEQLLNHSNNISSVDLRDKSLVGSMYINKDFLPVKLSNNNTIYSANYNAFQDEMVINNDGKLFVVAKEFSNLVTFVGINSVYRTYSYDYDGSETKGFFLIVSKGDKLSLLRKERINFYDAVEPKTGYDKYKPPTLKRESDKLFLGFQDNWAVEVPKKKKDIFKLFKGKEKVLETYAKEKKLNPKKEENLKQLVAKYNML